MTSPPLEQSDKFHAGNVEYSSEDHHEDACQSVNLHVTLSAESMHNPLNREIKALQQVSGTHLLPLLSPIASITASFLARISAALLIFVVKAQQVQQAVNGQIYHFPLQGMAKGFRLLLGPGRDMTISPNTWGIPGIDMKPSSSSWGKDSTSVAVSLARYSRFRTLICSSSTNVKLTSTSDLLPPELTLPEKPGNQVPEGFNIIMGLLII